LPFRRHLSFANVTAAIALFVALGGTGYAAIRVPRASVGNAQLQPNAVSASKIRADAVRASEIRRGAVGSSEIRTDAVGSSEIRRDGVASSEIRRGAVATAELRNGGVAAEDIASGAVGSTQLKAGGVDPVDLSTATKASFQAATLRAAIDESGALAAGNAKSATRTDTGEFTVTFDRDVSGCFYSATPVAVKTDTPDLRAVVTVASGGTNAPNNVLVKTSNAADAANEPFHLIVDC
jgi:hypothetical protein